MPISSCSRRAAANACTARSRSSLSQKSRPEAVQAVDEAVLIAAAVGDAQALDEELARAVAVAGQQVGVGLRRLHDGDALLEAEAPLHLDGLGRDRQRLVGLADVKQEAGEVAEAAGDVELLADRARERDRLLVVAARPLPLAAVAGRVPERHQRLRLAALVADGAVEVERALAGLLALDAAAA